MTSHGKAPRLVDQETQMKDIKRQLADHLGCLELRMESKLSLLAEFQEFFKRRGEVEYEYARSLERLCEKFERNTKQRNLRNEVRSTFNFWSTLLCETRKMSRERASLAEVMASEMVARIDVMVRDVNSLTKRCKEICVELQDQFLKELRDLSEQTKVYQHSCHNTSEAYAKVCKSKEKLDSVKGLSARRKAEDKWKERQKQYKIQKHLLLKNRNDYLLGISRCNALSAQYFNMDIMDIIENMDYDYHDSFCRLAAGLRDNEKETCEAIMQSGETLVEQSKLLNFEKDLHYFLTDYSGPFTAPNYFQFTSFEGDEVSSFKVTTEDVFRRWNKTMADLKEEIQTLKIQREEDIKTIQHIKQSNLRKYQITSVEDALALMEDNGDSLGLDGSKERGNASLERGLQLVTRGGQAIVLSQKGKKDTMIFILQITQRRILRADRLAVGSAQLDILEKAFDEQKVPPVPVGVDSQGRAIPGEVPKLFGGEIVKYILATGCEIPLIVESCIAAIEKNGMTMEGLFRVPGPAQVMEELSSAFEEGYDPLANYPHNKLDVAAVASTLKAYFRELKIPLFPTDKYQDFINCTRQEDMQTRLDALVSTLHTLPPQVIPVMRFLFRFLHRVSLHAADNKMGSPNLALVFGPTLTRAPDSLDPRQLHNDVPSVNMLIQMCIDRHDYIFGEAEDTSVVSPSPNDDVGSIPLSTSPPTEPPSAPPSDPPKGSPSTSPSHLSKDLPSDLPPDPPSDMPIDPLVTTSTPGPMGGNIFDEEVCDLPPPPRPPRTSMEVQLPPDGAAPPPRPPKPEAMTPPPPPDLEERSTEEVTKVPVESSDPAVRTLRDLSPAVVGSHHDVESSNTSQTSGADLSSLEAKMQEIEDSIQEMSMSEDTPTPTPQQAQDEEEEEESDSEDEDEGDARIGARALYDYIARSDKELSFNRGDALQVITKTPDNNWWDGFHSGKRGFIPVAYVEITELKTSPSPLPAVETIVPESSSPVPTGGGSMAVPAPPLRKSSIPASQAEGEAEAGTKVSEVPSQPAIEEEEGEGVVQNSEQSQGDSVCTSPPPAVMVTNESAEKDYPVDVKSPSEPVTTVPPTKVRSLTMQFQEPEPQQPKVLVEPHTHRRHGSDNFKASADPKEPLPRSASGGSKVSMLSSTFESKATAPTGPPPPIRPKPTALTHSNPTSPAMTAPAGAEVFPLMQHGSAAGVSPLQKAAHQGQHIAPKPALGKKPVPPAVAKVGGKTKSGSVRVKKKDSLKEKDKGSKPAPNPKPSAGFAATPAEIQAELQARAKRRQSEDKL